MTGQRLVRRILAVGLMAAGFGVAEAQEVLEVDSTEIPPVANQAAVDATPCGFGRDLNENQTLINLEFFSEHWCNAITGTWEGTGTVAGTPFDDGGVAFVEAGELVTDDGFTFDLVTNLLSLTGDMDVTGEFKLLFDVANHLLVTVASDGTVTFESVGTNPDMELRTANFSNAIFIDDSAKRVGLGIAFPGTPFHVFSSDIVVARFESSGADAIIQIRSTNAFNGIWSLRNSVVGDFRLETLAGTFPFVVNPDAANNTLIVNSLGIDVTGTITANGGDILIDGGAGIGGTLDIIRGASETTGIAARFDGAIRIAERSTDPSAPAEGQCIIWMSDGTSSGADGDLMATCTAGAVTNTRVFSAH